MWKPAGYYWMTEVRRSGTRPRGKPNALARLRTGPLPVGIACRECRKKVVRTCEMHLDKGPLKIMEYELIGFRLIKGT